MRILLVEDSRRLQQALGKGLRRSGYAVDIAGDGEEGLWLAQSNDYDAIVLDWMLPKLDGMEVLSRLRKSGLQTNVLMLTARDTVDDRVQGLSRGADDYLVKPFAFEELLARIQTLIRRGYGKKNPEIRVGGLALNTATRSVRVGGEDVMLTPRDYALLELFVMNQGRLVTRSQIESHVYDERAEPSSNVVEAAVYSLRRKIDRPGLPSFIQTRRGAGYILMEPRDEIDS